MQPGSNCIVCDSRSITSINSYKHIWLSCNDCGTISRKRKDKYIVPRFLPRSIANSILPTAAVHMLYPMQEVIEEESAFYDYYDQASELNVEETKWYEQIEDIQKKLDLYKIDIREKKILDISGGPGFVGVEFAKIAKKVVVTEYSETAVAGMKRNLGIEAVKFDYKKDKINQVLNEKFDIIFINHSINFCTDLPNFVRDLKDILHSESFVYISFVTPSLGCCLRWQHDEYTYDVLYHQETIGRAFAEEGYSAVVKNPYPSYGYMDNIRYVVKLFRLPYTVWYTLRALNPMASINRELIQKSVLHIYRCSDC